LVSSTAVAFTFSRVSRQEADHSYSLALGVVGASTLMNLRVLAATVILKPGLAVALVPYLAAPFLIGLVTFLAGWKRSQEGAVVEESRNPLQLASAVQMTLLFQAVLFAVYFVQFHWGQTGLLWSGAALGLTDVDALTISMARGAEAQIPISTAAKAIAVGVLSNTILKLSLGIIIGKDRFRWLVPAWLAAMGVASAVSIVALR
jgi:uncharacterized membrane protein (DUF4010 family)